MKNNRIHVNVHAKKSEEQGVISGYASVFGVVDSDNDVIEPGAFAETISTGAAKDGVYIFPQHVDDAMPLGKTTELREDNKGLRFTAYISDTADGRNYRKLIKDGILTQVSIGYNPVDYYVDDHGIRHIRAVELYEISVVNYPANTHAKIDSYKGGKKMGKKRKKSADEETELLEEGMETSPEEILEQVEVLLEEVKAMKSGGEEENKSEDEETPSPGGVLDRVEELLEEVKAMKSDGEDEDKSDEDDDKDEGEGEKGRKSRKRNPYRKSSKRRSVERKYADIYTPRGGGEQKSKLPPGIRWVRFQKCMAMAKGDYEHAAQIARKSYDDTFLSRETKALSVTSPTDGGYLVPEVFAEEVIPLLYAKSIVMGLGAVEIPMEHGNLTIPKMLSGSSAAYVGELRRTNPSQPSFGSIKLSAKKLMCKIPVSNDLIRSTAFSADQIILNDAVTQMALKLDQAALFGSGGEFQPTGIFKMKGIQSIDINGLPGESTTGSMLAQLLRSNIDTSNLGWGFNGYAWQAFYNVISQTNGFYLYRSEMDEGRLSGHKYLVSTQMPFGKEPKFESDIILGNWSDFIVGRQGTMQSEWFREGTIETADGETISAVDHDVTILRIIDLHDFAVRHPLSFVIGKKVTVA